MRVVIQRVTQASVTVKKEIVGQINHGLLVLLGIETEDSLEDVDWLLNKTLNLRIFNDENGVMNKSLLETGGELLVISQFTLMAAKKRGIDLLIFALQNTNKPFICMKFFVKRQKHEWEEMWQKVSLVQT